MGMIEHSVFVPNGPSRRETATLLVGTAREFGIHQRAIRTSPNGFYITEELAEVLGGDEGDTVTIGGVTFDVSEEEEEEPDEEPFDPSGYNIDGVKDFVSKYPDTASNVLDSERNGQARKTLIEWLVEFNQTSGNRAAKNSTTEEE